MAAELKTSGSGSFAHVMQRFATDSPDKIPRSLFALSVVMLAFGYGVVAEHYNLFPVSQVKNAKAAARELLEDSRTQLPWYYRRTRETQQIRVRDRVAMAPGLTLVTGLGSDEETWARVVDSTGKIIHKWQIDWFEIWPQPTHLSSDLIPKSNGGLVHGVVVAPNGDLVFSFEELGMVRMDPCGRVIWKLPYRTHHSVHLDDLGNIWTSGIITRHEKRADLPNYEPPFADYTILQVSPDGRVLQEMSVFDLLNQNDLRGLLHLSTVANRNTRVSGDTLHLNDVEIFPASMNEGVFSHGDVMISLRNINAVLVFEPAGRRIKFLSVGAVLRQHDPDFIDGDTISVFDNNNLSSWSEDSGQRLPAGHYSRIIRLSAKKPDVHVVFSGSQEQPFFTDIMGKHQWLENGNILITEAIGGRVFEIDSNGRIVWEFLNLVGDGLIGVIDDAERLAPAFNEAFFAKAASTCQS